MKSKEILPKDIETYGAKVRNKLTPPLTLAEIVLKQEDKLAAIALETAEQVKKSVASILELTDDYSESYHALEQECEKLMEQYDTIRDERNGYIMRYNDALELATYRGMMLHVIEKEGVDFYRKLEGYIKDDYYYKGGMEIVKEPKGKKDDPLNAHEVFIDQSQCSYESGETEYYGEIYVSLSDGTYLKYHFEC